MKLTVNYPNLPPDADVEVAGLGIFANGHVYNITDKGQLDHFHSQHSPDTEGKRHLVLGEKLDSDTPVEPFETEAQVAAEDEKETK